MNFHDAANIFPLDENNLDKLAEDIQANGQQVPIEILDGKVIDGRRRTLACKRAGVKPLTREVQVDDPVAYVLSLNLHRRHLAPTQLAMVGARVRGIYDKQAKERQKNHGGTAPGKAKSLVENLPPVTDSGKARDAVGEAIGVSGKSIDHATRVLTHGSQALIAAVDADQIAVSTAARATGLCEAEQNALAKRAAERLEKGFRPRKRPTTARDDRPARSEPDGKIKGVGVMRANEAVNCLIQIPKNDALRKRGFQIVADWIKRNP